MARRANTTRKVLLSLAAIGAAGSIAGLGTFATFTSTTSADQTVASGTVVIGLGSGGSADNRLTIGATGLVSGDTVQRRVKLTNTGSQNLASVTLTTVDTVETDTVLSTDATNGLQMKIEKCDGTWTESGTNPYTYSCSGSTSAVLAERAVIGSGLALTGLTSLTAGSTDDMVVTLRLPATADNTFQNKSATIGYTFNATQRAATDK